MIKLWAWEIDQLDPVPNGLAPNAAYLIRVNYDFDVAPEAPVPVWAEVEIAFENEITVLDVLPRVVHTSESHHGYQLDQQLHFVLQGSDTSARPVPLPPPRPRVECFGGGGRTVRWRHTGVDGAGVPVGSHVGYLVLLVPPDRETLDVLASGQYRVAVDPALGLAPASQPDAFTVRLPRQAPGDRGPAPVEEPAAATRAPGPAATAENLKPRVFITYSRDSPEHVEQVVNLWHLLAQHKVDVRIDRTPDINEAGQERTRNWMDWTNAQILRSDFVVVIASPNYLAASENRLPPGENLGVHSEYLRLANLLQADRPLWTRKILTVLLPGRSVNEIPLAFLGHIVNHYVVRDFTPRGAASLFRALGLDPS